MLFHKPLSYLYYNNIFIITTIVFLSYAADVIIFLTAMLLAQHPFNFLQSPQAASQESQDIEDEEEEEDIIIIPDDHLDEDDDS